MEATDNNEDARINNGQDYHKDVKCEKILNLQVIYVGTRTIEV
jgi:hypothetical protein